MKWVESHWFFCGFEFLIGTLTTAILLKAYFNHNPQEIELEPESRHEPDPLRLQ